MAVDRMGQSQGVLVMQAVQDLVTVSECGLGVECGVRVEIRGKSLGLLLDF